MRKCHFSRLFKNRERELLCFHTQFENSKICQVFCSAAAGKAQVSSQNGRRQRIVFPFVCQKNNDFAAADRYF
jgi:hypothetical protein